MRNDKEKYLFFCQTETTIPIFMQPWWLDVVCQKGKWGVFLFEKNNEIVAASTYFLCQKAGLTYMVQPPLTPYSGIWWQEKLFNKKYQQYHHVKTILNQWIAQFPNVTFFQQQYHYNLTDWQPFYWQGFQQTTRYTYILNLLQGAEQLFSHFHDTTKRKIRKATDRNLEILRFESETDTTVFDTFYHLNTLTFQKQGLKNPIHPALFKRLDAVLKEKQQRTIYLARDAAGRYYATLYLVYDSKTAYYLAGGVDTSILNNNALFLLLWKAIQDAAQRVPTFDFEGSMLPQIEPIFRSFGATQMPYFRIFKAKNRFWALANAIFKVF
jgi:Acetyltransferase (GNAT) domain